ncbi:MAG: Kiwa anti-phage protein KwaB-like domain-containing protein [Mucilaginibacter sp.]
MKAADVLAEMQNLDLDSMSIHLAIVSKSYKKNYNVEYGVKFVHTNNPLANRLRAIVKDERKTITTLKKYTPDGTIAEDGLALYLESGETDFADILTWLKENEPDSNLIKSKNELANTKSYMLVFRDVNGVQLVGFKNVPENWKLKQDKGIIPIVLRDTRFENLETPDVFSISSRLDFICFRDELFILSKKDFEIALSFREGLQEKSAELYKEVKELGVFLHQDMLETKVGKNMRYLRKIAVIKDLGHYKNKEYLKKLEKNCADRGYNVKFEKGQIVISEESIDDILTLLQNKRLYSELTEEIFDADSVTKYTKEPK